MAKVGCGRMLSQSPPRTVHFQPVACAAWPFTIQVVPSIFWIDVGLGKGFSWSGAVGHVTTAVWHEQSVMSLFSGRPSQLKSPTAQTSCAYGGCAPRQGPDHLGNSVPGESSEPFQFSVHQPTGLFDVGSVCAAATRGPSFV